MELSSVAFTSLGETCVRKMGKELTKNRKMVIVKIDEIVSLTSIVVWRNGLEDKPNRKGEVLIEKK